MRRASLERLRALSTRKSRNPWPSPCDFESTAPEPRSISVGMRFEALVQTSEAVRQTRSRLQKLEHLARCIGELGRTALGAEADAAGSAGPGAPRDPAALRSALAGVAYLAGDLPDGRIGLGPSAIYKNPPGSAQSVAVLTVAEVDRR